MGSDSTGDTTPILCQGESPGSIGLILTKLRDTGIAGIFRFLSIFQW